jgi:sigma-B regulation protein RsbU (phosphoserine phosphatase)
MGINYRMNIRTKLLLILLAFSLTPLIAVTIISQQGTRRLGKTVSEDSFKNLTEITSKALEQTASISARAILQSKTGLEYALLVLAAQAEQALTSPYQDPSKIFMAWQFDDPAAAPPDLVISSAYLTKTKAGGAAYQKISFNHPVFITAPGVPEQHAAGAISRLARLTESFKTLSIKFGDSLHWASVSLENGVHVSYPGHGGYSDDYDPRKLD